MKELGSFLSIAQKTFKVSKIKTYRLAKLVRGVTFRGQKCSLVHKPWLKLIPPNGRAIYSKK